MGILERAAAWLIILGAVFLMGLKTGLDTSVNIKTRHALQLAESRLVELEKQKEINKQAEIEFEERKDALHAAMQNAATLLGQYRAEAERCRFSATFRGVHDAAAAPGLQVPRAAPGINATPKNSQGLTATPTQNFGLSVGGFELAETLVENYQACHDNALQLESLQAWVRSQRG